MRDYFDGLTAEIHAKAAGIKLLVTDVDGVLTDGGIIYDNAGMEYKRFHVRDGLIVSHLRKNDILVGAITGRNSKVVRDRCDVLHFDFHYHGVRDKAKKLMEILETLEISLEEVAFIGDDIIDLPILTRVGLSACPQDAPPYIQEAVDYVSPLAGGQGAFRQFADCILKAQGSYRIS
ncbi:3-deoxy-D-manno-octulosonate 8-phosphate phosphatase [Nitritalea halalkaliphila LW7]|uniref:3-deoxy-D-manno-octulosonate 8-phosphate phosphatase KdsC n=1 Tax=Nitritalea halalkaliphila LW7 TaxID=1189621 RepID=I5BY42_9BACT|nr:HAD hydrolase family protein [Nitritalea halalkaliphila]EIM74494.1 3-deoxy-D-manno-octulosonate 8-phosphate phosphatase [Nitritalea halalkaliphila LW7]